MKKTFAKLIGIGTSLTLLSAFAQSAFAQLTQSTGSSVTKGGLGGVTGSTLSSLPNAGSTEVTYLIFGLGIIFFVFGMMKLVSGFRD